MVASLYSVGNVGNFVQCYLQVAKTSKKSKITFDLAIFDEAHKTVGRKDKLFSKLLFEENINIRQRLFMN